MKFRLVGYGLLVTLLMLSIIAFISYFIVEVIIQSKSLSSLLNQFIWTEESEFWRSFSKDQGTLMTSEFSISSFQGSSINHDSLEFKSMDWIKNFVFDRSVNLKNIEFKDNDETISSVYEMENEVVDIGTQAVKIVNPAMIRYLDSLSSLTKSNLFVYVLAKLFQDREQYIDLLKISFCVQNIFLDPKFTLYNYQIILEKKFGYQVIDYVKLFLDPEFGMFNDQGFYYWLKILYEKQVGNEDEYNYMFNTLNRKMNNIAGFDQSQILQYIFFDKENSLNLESQFANSMTYLSGKLKSYCKADPCTNEEINLLQWGKNIMNQFLNRDSIEGFTMNKSFNISHIITLDISSMSNATFTIEESRFLMSTDPDNSQYSLMSLSNSKFLENQLSNQDYPAIQKQFNLDSEDDAKAIFNFYSKIYNTLNDYSDNFKINYLKSSITQKGLLGSLHKLEIFTYNNITSLRMQDKIKEKNYNCLDIFDINPYLKMCNNIETNIDYESVIRLFVSAFFNLDSEKDAREYIKKVMQEDDSYLDKLFSPSSKVTFRVLLGEIEQDISDEYKCGNSCRKILAEKQFLDTNLFESLDINSIIDLKDNENYLDYIPELHSVITLLQNNTQEASTCNFLSNDVLNYNTNSILNINQLSLIYTYAQLNNKFNLINFLKVRCDPKILSKSFEYFFIAWGLDDFYINFEVKELFVPYQDKFLEKVKKQKEIDIGLPDINTSIDFKILSKKIKFEAKTGKSSINGLRRITKINDKSFVERNASYMFQSLLDYSGLNVFKFLAGEKSVLKFDNKSKIC